MPVRDAVLVGSWEPGSSEWVEARRGGLGGSEGASVVGLSPWRSRWRLWQEKAGNLDPDRTDSTRLRMGRFLEAAVVAEAEHRGLRMRRTGMWRNIERPWQLAEPDRLLVATRRGMTPTGVFEAKTVDPSMAWQWGPDGSGEDGIPPHYLVQVRWYLTCLGLDHGVLGALVGFGDYRQYEVGRDRQDEEWLLGEAQRFVESVEAGDPPSLDGSDSTWQGVRRLHPGIRPGEAVVGVEDAAACWRAREALEAAEDEYRRTRGGLLETMGDARTAVTPGGELVARRQPGRGETVVFRQLMRKEPTE